MSRTIRRQAPPLEAIEAFILATRSSSFRDAADRLALSPSAFSRRIQALEAFVGVALFVRDKGSVTLSKTGERYLRMVEPAIDSIRRATVDLQAERGGMALRVVVPQSFAIGWLIPNLPDFQHKHADVKVELRIGRDIDDLRRGHADVAIYVGPGNIGSMPAIRIAPINGVMVSAPVLASGSAPPTSLAELPNVDRLAVYRPEGLWERWLRNLKYDGPPLAPPTYFEAQFLMFEAAAAGLGVAIVAPILAHRLLDQGRLVRLGAHEAPLGIDYYLVSADEAVQRRPDAIKFRKWIGEGLARFS
ncbi:LysR substrate-binding domain-containing protein [Sphingopyxis indica]|uniref:LysR family transcriptional regulator, glycine cleavage system transcriptional activator n=1 Tax=Sphingopyxis indica TaxID=436663 RepID=A0A239JV15_9SPHN|nr:LysR substrate-binding domain-containing protein [Sphingopyxis indica]SNT09776.1 LysR family transcriptional regulator, glycine cleavage system transcriptional activator [Sphingopyxis indica]